MATQEELLNQASEICGAEHEGENTAVRVGTMLINIIEYLGQFMTNTQLETALQEVSEGLNGWLEGYARIDSNSGLLDYNHSWFVPLSTMGTAFDESPEEYTPTPGELYYKNQSGYQIHIKTASGGIGSPAKMGVVYFNKRTGKSYKWNGSSMDELGTAAVHPQIIDYFTAPPFSDIAVGQSYLYTAGNVRRLAVKTGSDSSYSFDPDPKVIYCFKDTRTTMIWDNSTGTWQQVGGGGDVEVINSLGSTETRKPLSAKMGHDLLVLIQQIYSSLGKAAFWGNRPEIDWSSIGLLTHAVTRNLSHCHSNKTYNQIADGSPLNETITFDEGYVKDTLTVTMNNVEVPSQYISGNTINIPSVTGPVVIAATATSAKSVILNLTGCSSSNNDAGVSEGAAYITKIEGDGLNKVVGRSGFSVKMKNGQGVDVTLPIVLEDGYPLDSAPSENNHINIDSVPCVVFKSDLTSIENGAKVQIGKPYYEVRIPEVTGDITIVATAVDFIVAGPWYIGSSTPGSSETWCRNSEPIPIARVSPFDTVVWAHYGVSAGQTGNALSNKAVCEFNSYYFHKTQNDSIWKYNQNSDIVTETGDRATQARLIFASFTYEYLSNCYVQGSGGNNTTAIFKPSAYVENQ